MRLNDESLTQAISNRSTPLRTKSDLRPLVDRISRAKIVMLGESTHGTHEFYEWRRLITAWLIVKHGFKFVAVEGEWPPCWRLNRYIGAGEGENAREALGQFQRWPTWLWANTEIIRLAEWMRSHNEALQEQRKDTRSPALPVGFYGLDVYSFFDSMDALVRQLERINPFVAKRARLRLECFDPFQRDEKSYIQSLLEYPQGCQGEILEILNDLLRVRIEGLAPESGDYRNEILNAQQCARVLSNGEKYYRAMIHGDEKSWNVRDRHMMETLNLLLKHHGDQAKCVVWAHNTHVGDYRATDMVRAGQVNIGGLAREEWGEENVALVGFGTYEGQVIASHSWDGPIERMHVPPAREESYEAAYHHAARARGESALITLMDPNAKHSRLSDTLGHRAIGVVYDPAFERVGNYVPTSLAQRYDAFIFFDQTHALEPLIQGANFDEIPENWPVGQ